MSDILPTVRKRGVIQTLIVRPNGTPGAYEILAGSRRFHAAKIIAQERLAQDAPSVEPGTEPETLMLPCAILDAHDDAAAIEASLIENLARLDPDEVTQWESFVRLIKEGRTPDDISMTFGLPEPTVRRILALGNLLPRIRAMYRAETIDRITVRHLTMASKSQQKSWLALADDPDSYLPTGHQLKAWLFGGQSIPTALALFDLDGFAGQTIADLFGDDRYFTDPDQFWAAQTQAIEARRADYLEAGWPDVITVGPAEHFHIWEYEKAPKRKGGRVYIDVRSNGEVSFHEGYVSRAEARRTAKGDMSGGQKPPRPEVSGPLQTYIDLHRHAAVRAKLTQHPSVALRLMVAHAIAGSPLWSVRPEPQTARSDAVRESVESCRGEGDFDERRRAVLALLDFSPEEPTVTGGVTGGVTGDHGRHGSLTALFLRLLDLPDPVVMDVIAIVIGETLGSGSAAVEAVGLHINVDMADYWQADDAFFDLLRNREVLSAIVADVAGEPVARANAQEKAKTLKRIVRDHLEGVNGRTRPENWVPRWMAFPPQAYTARGGVGTVGAYARVEAARAALRSEPDPRTPDDGAPASGPIPLAA